jgi:uncharacterized membrane protein YkoI
MTSQRFAAAITRAAFRAGVTAGLAAVLLAAGNAAAARVQALPLMQGEAADEALGPAQRDQLAPSQRGGGVSLAQASSMAQSRYQGRVVRAETVQAGDRRVHEIRILGDDGRVHIVRIDAETGAFL